MNQAIYLIRAENGLVKVGRATAPKQRFSAIRVASPLPLELIHVAVVEDAQGVEAALHEEFADRRSHGEWYRLTEADIASVCQRYPATDVRYMGQLHPVLLGVTPEQYALFKEAARLSGMKVTQFILHSGLAAAEETLGKTPTWT